MRSFSLLLSSDNHDTALTDDGVADEPGAGRSVLVIDDHQFCSKLMSRLLSRAGFRVMIVATVKAAELLLEGVDAVVCNVEARGDAKALANIPLVFTTARRIEDCDDSYDDIDADDISLCGNVVDAVLEALWDPRSALKLASQE